MRYALYNQIVVYLLIILFVTIGSSLLPLVAPKLISKHFRFKTHDSLKWLPVLAAALFFVAFLIPDIHISLETSAFQQHFVGGGVYAACMFVYFKKLLNKEWPLIITLIMLFAWVSMLGVSNELLEFVMTKLNVSHINLGDADWDLLANSLGALFGYAALHLSRIENNTPKTRIFSK